MNILLIMSDEHRRDLMGCAGHPLVQTPNLDALSAQGVRFANAYCNSPLCVPSRASFATGLHVHETENWDNAKPYAGTHPSWGKYLSEAGVQVVTVGKLHFDPASDTGFADQRRPTKMSRDGGGLHRSPVQRQAKARERFNDVGAGDFWFDRTEKETEAAIDFIAHEAGREGKPWALWLDYVPPHFPLVAPRPFYDLYPEDAVDLPYDNPSAEHHPALEEMRTYFDGRNIDEATLRRTRAAYYGLVSYIDHQVGRVVQALQESGQAEDTLVIYTSDHGESLGDHDLWWKCTMYEQSVGVPLIMAGPSIPRGEVRTEPVSLIDVTATLADALGQVPPPSWQGRSLLPIAQGKERRGDDEVVFSQYHAHGVSHGIFMIRKGQFKYVYYPHFPAQLFNLENDPRELHDLAIDASYAPVLADLHAALTRIVNPEEVDERALADQRKRLQELEALKNS
ncbi:MAG TPA: sulfatase-like hydrolase/transferase [Ktedonobacteraceae bacterium]|jgi:choline-sulfatase|nr:sulfatase-like hydrolase/transferase [Ktedonobacteraceae bacterium]